MANNFDTDNNCIEYWLFENNLTAGKNGNDLTANPGGVGYTSSSPLEGSYSLDLENDSNQGALRTNANLTSNFPFKSTDTAKIGTVLVRIRPETLASYLPIWAKCYYYASSVSGSIALVADNTELKIAWGTSTGKSYYSTGISVANGQDYHIAVVIDGITPSLYVRVYDYSATTVYTYSTTPANELPVKTVDFCVGSWSDGPVNHWDGLIDELVIFDSILTDDEIDDIRDGVFGPAVPTVTTQTMTSVSCSTAVAHGTVEDDGYSEITERGFAWAETPDPDTGDDTVTVSGTTGVYSATITGLTANTAYHVRAYAINSEGTGYGADQSFSTPDVPSVTTSAVTDIAPTSVNAHGEVTDNGGEAVTRGFVWSTGATPTLADNYIVVAGDEGVYAGHITGLLPETTYYTRAYATNCAGTTYGSAETWTTTKESTAVARFRERSNVQESLHLPEYQGNPWQTFPLAWRELQRQWRAMATYVNTALVFFEQPDEPTLFTGQLALWHDTTTGNYYFIINAGGTQQKIQFVSSTTSWWDDLRISGLSTKLGATPPDLITFGPSGNLKIYAFDGSSLTEEVFFALQMPHGYKQGTDLKPHVHWTPTDTNTGNVVWQLEYTWANIAGTFAAPTPIETTAVAAGGTAWVHKISDFSDIDGTGKTISSMLVCRLFRDPDHGSDTYEHDAAFLEFDIHYEIDSMGSTTPTAK